MRLFRSFSSCAWFVCLFVSGNCYLFPQTNRGSISGTVSDPTGSRRGGGTITATETSTGTTYNTITSSSGNYSIPQAVVGTYNVTVSSPNFATGQRTGVIVQINTATVLNVSLPVGKQQATVTVVANAPTNRVDSFALVDINDFDGVVAESRHEEPAALRIDGHMIDPALYIWQRDAGFESQWRIRLRVDAVDAAARITNAATGTMRIIAPSSKARRSPMS